jgi:amino acid transporter
MENSNNAEIRPLSVPPPIPAVGPTVRRTSRLAQASFVLTFVVVAQFMYLSMRSAKEWHGDADWQSLVPLTACCVISALAVVVCGIIGSLRILRNRGRLQGLGWSLAAIALSSLLMFWSISGLVDLARLKARKVRQGAGVPPATCCSRSCENSSSTRGPQPTPRQSQA